jgi:hypothetical protein
MQSSDILAARAAAILAARRHNAGLFALRGCEDLDKRYAALTEALRKAKLMPAGAEDAEADGAALYPQMLDRSRSDAAFAANIEAAIGGEYESDFGKLVAYVVANWDRLPEPQRALADAGGLWIGPATAGWPPELLNALHDELQSAARLLYLFTNIWLLRRYARLLDPARLRATRDFPGLTFAAVLDEELEEIEALRGAPSTAALAGHPVDRADAADLTGLAFSGGGIRSATFNLGVLQFLGEHGLLRRFDYLSTVSGGGYIGSWLHAWIHHADRETPGAGVERVQQSLSPTAVPDPQDERVAPIRFLRRYSSYLTPQSGLLSADTWTMANIWLRNTSLNLLVLMLALSAVLLAPHWLAAASSWLDVRQITDYWWILLIAPAWIIGRNLAAIGAGSPRHKPAWLCRNEAIVALVAAPVFLAAWAGGTVVPRDLFYDEMPPNRIFLENSVVFALVMAGLVLLTSFTAGIRAFYSADRSLRRFVGTRAVAWILGVCLIASVSSGVLDYVWLRGFIARLVLDNPLKILTASVPAFLGLVSLTVFLYMGLLGRRFPDDRREWIARLGGFLGIYAIAWAGLCGIAAYGPALVHWLSELRYAGMKGITFGWVLTTASGLLSARSAASGQSGREGSPLSRILVAIAPPIFVFGLLLALSVVLDKAAAPQHPWWSVAASIACGGAALLLSRRIDINEFSLHQFYRNRLVRCYLGGARAGSRHPNCFTGFDDSDDVRLTALAPSAGHSGPYPILNTTLNVVHGDELAWQERKAEAFAFTPRFCGFDVDRGRATHPRKAGQPHLSYGGYRPTGDFAYPNPEDSSPCLTDSGISVGTAMAISGAAASPNMGAGTSAALAFLMTVLDVRLGWWIGNPRRNDTWRRAGPSTGLFQLLAELTANTNDTGPYVYLSDGGHFENLAAYELIRRRCRCIVVCDSEQDSGFTFGGLGNLIRKCRSDFGVDIEIDAGAIKPRPGERRSQVHCAVGTIRYPGAAGGAGPEGVLLYIKSSLTGDEPADVMQYSLRIPLFPHESTADQWFGESQFESYRALGYHVAGQAFADLQRSEAASQASPVGQAIGRITPSKSAAAAANA